MFYGLLSEANEVEQGASWQIDQQQQFALDAAISSNGTNATAVQLAASALSAVSRQQQVLGQSGQSCSIWCEDFDSFFNASVVLFQVLTSAGWSNVMYRCMEVFGLGAQTFWTSYTLFIAIIVIEDFFNGFIIKLRLQGGCFFS